MEQVVEEEAPGRTLISFGRGLLAEVVVFSGPAGMTSGEWVRSCVRRELARLKAEKGKGRK